MTKIDHEVNNASVRRAELRRQANFNRVVTQERKIRNRTQAQYRQFIAEHSHEHQFLAKLADVIKQRPLSRHETDVCRQISTERGWPIRPAGDYPKSSRKARRHETERREPEIRKRLREAAEVVSSYTGADGWIRYLKREFAGDPSWLPTVKQAEAIMRQAA